MVAGSERRLGSDKGGATRQQAGIELRLAAGLEWKSKFEKFNSRIPFRNRYAFRPFFSK
jgi:hypothetical protein